MERQKSGCSQIKVGALFVKGPHNSKDPIAGRRRFVRSAGVSSSWGSKMGKQDIIYLFMYGKEFFFLSVRDKEFFLYDDDDVIVWEGQAPLRGAATAFSQAKKCW